MSSLSSRDLVLASKISRDILETFRECCISRKVARFALVAALSEVDPFAHFSFRFRTADGNCVHGSVRIVSEPVPEVVCSHSDNTPF